MFSLTALYGQTGNSDTVTCFNNDELKQIATKLVYAKECDTIKNILQQKVIVKDSIIFSLHEALLIKETLINNNESIIHLKNNIIHKREQDMGLLIKEINKCNKHKKGMKIGFIATAVTLTAAFITALAL